MQLSWDADLDVGTIAVRPDIREKVSILYNDDRITTLTALQCRIANTGNKVVKGQQLRFSFGPDVRVLEAYLDPSPGPELQVEETDESHGRLIKESKDRPS
jgi:hypothetical protein